MKKKIKMNKQLIISAVLAFFASYSMAQSAFEGFYGQVGTGYEDNSFSSINTSFVNTTLGNVYGSGSAGSQNASGTPLVIGAGYFHSIQDSYLLGFGIDYSPLSMQSGNFATYSTNNLGDSSPINNMSYKASNRFNAYLMPAYAFDADKMGYLKLGYSTQNLQYTQGSDSVSRLDSGFTSSKSISGYVLGLGYKQMIASGIYGFAEGNYYSYGKSTLNGNGLASSRNIAMSSTASVSAYNFLIGLGYKF